MVGDEPAVAGVGAGAGGGAGEGLDGGGEERDGAVVGPGLQGIGGDLSGGFGRREQEDGFW